MITTTTVKTYSNYTIDRYTYSADISATGEQLITYEVNNGDMTVFGAFDTLKEAINFIRREY